MTSDFTSNLLKCNDIKRQVEGFTVIAPSGKPIKVRPGLWLEAKEKARGEVVVAREEVGV